MAKDPAFLFYPSDFIIGTAFMNYEQKGKYISLICYQHQLGHLSDEQMISICGAKDEMIFGKFKKDETGLYYNERLDVEKTKRNLFCKSRKLSRTSNVRGTYVERMENENENSNTTNTTINLNKEEKKQYLEFVYMTQGQHDQLAQKLGITVLNTYVERLNNYIGSQGKRYKSHYHTILSWHAKDGGIKPYVSKPIDNRDLWEKKANKHCTNCRGKGAVYAAGTGQFAKCGCVK